jgi:hypothetical protein
MLDTPIDRTIETFRACLDKSEQVEAPWRHWLIAGALPEDVVDRVLDLPYAPPEAGTFDGRREANNSTRVFFGKAEQARHPVCAELAALFRDAGTIAAIEKTCHTDLSTAKPRIEYTQDVDGFWLEPHTDLGVKRLTALIYLSDGPGHDNLGTDIFSVDKEPVKRSPFAPNVAMAFVPSDNTYHGFERRPIDGVRRSLILNYVTKEWRNRDQLAFPHQTVCAG